MIARRWQLAHHKLPSLAETTAESRLSFSYVAADQWFTRFSLISSYTPPPHPPPARCTHPMPPPSHPCRCPAPAPLSASPSHSASHARPYTCCRRSPRQFAKTRHAHPQTL